MRHVPVCETGDASLVRPKYSPGLLLEDTDLTGAVDFTRSLSSLLLRAMLGAGVLCGFKVMATVEKKCMHISVRRGIGVDSCGALVELPHDVSVNCEIACDDEKKSAEFAVLIRRDERPCGQRDVACVGGDATVADKLRESYSINVVAWDDKGAWSSKIDAPVDGNCRDSCDCCDNKGKPLLLAKIYYTTDSMRVDHSVRSYVRPATAPDPIHDLALPTPPAAPAAPAPATTIT